MADDMADPGLLCALCFHPFNPTTRKPLAMPACVHTVCGVCAAQLGEGRREGLRCPVCDKAFEEGSPEVRLGVLHAVAHNNDEEEDDDEEDGARGEEEDNEGQAGLCRGCQHKSDHPAVFHCSGCDELLCAAAISAHLNKPGTHALTNLPTPHHAALLPPSSLVCAVHNQALVFACEDDGQLACHACAATTHKGHALHNADDAARGRVEELRALVAEIEGKVEELTRGASGVRADRDGLFSAVAVVEAEVNAFFDEVLQIRSSLLGKLHKAKKLVSQQHADIVATARALTHAAHHARAVLHAAQRDVPSVGVAVTVRQLQRQLQQCNADISVVPVVRVPVRFVHDGLDVDVLRSKLQVRVSKGWELQWDALNSDPQRSGGLDGPAIVARGSEGWHFVVGKDPIPARCTTPHFFSVRADKLVTTHDFVVGVTSRDSVADLNEWPPRQCWLWLVHGSRRVFANGAPAGKLEGAPIADGSVVTVVVDPACGRLTFVLDGVECGSLGFPGDVDVRPVLCLYWAGGKATVVESGVRW